MIKPYALQEFTCSLDLKSQCFNMCYEILIVGSKEIKISVL